MEVMQNTVGLIEYLGTWRWLEADVIEARGGVVCKLAALPLLVDDAGKVLSPGEYAEGAPVFAGDRAAFDYMCALSRRDLQHRGFRDDRVATWEYKCEANYLLLQRVVRAADDHEYAMLRQRWDEVNRPKYVAKEWSAAQNEVLEIVEAAVSHADEESLQKSYRWLYVLGPPGSGKSAVLLETAIRMAKQGLRVLIVCPTGTNVYSFKSQLPDLGRVFGPGVVRKGLGVLGVGEGVGAGVWASLRRTLPAWTV